MKNSTFAFSFLIVFLTLGCSPKTTITANSNTVTTKASSVLEDGMYLVIKTGKDKAALGPLSETQQIIPYHKELMDSDDDPFLVIDVPNFVPISLKEKPTTKETDDKRQNLYLALNDEAKVKLEQFTTLNLNKTTAIVVNGEAFSKHKIKSIIDGGYLQITQCSENTCRILYDQLDDNVIGLPSHKDWANLQRFRKENTELKKMEINKGRVVFMGNSITEGWKQDSLNFFDNPNYVNRGISGQTTPQMLVRFRPDVIELNPEAVVILAGINDIAGNTGPMSIEAIANNIFSMADLSAANGIKVILCSVLPAYDFPWRPGLNPADKVIKLNKLIEQYASKNGHSYVDYFSAMVDERKGLPIHLASDEIHPTVEGYHLMESIIAPAIKQILNSK